VIDDMTHFQVKELGLAQDDEEKIFSLILRAYENGRNDMQDAVCRDLMRVKIVKEVLAKRMRRQW
jgi:hypothetical protein